MSTIEIREARYADPDPQTLTAEVQAEYQRRYGGPGDVAPIDTAEFDPPAGRFFVLYVADVPAAMGGWRRGGAADGDAEIKRMFVRPGFVRQGLARLLLSEIEATAQAAGITRLVLETGPLQHEAVALYTSSGYEPVEPFGYYAGQGSSHLGKLLTAKVGK